ncbi:MAG: D-alanine--D-alanine ligase [Bacteroidota bacterium]|nr:D-alanine--D-alanine ligase [Bacteroidota bacterium]MDP4234770.1 D-alanine--D-alanine ligase [Bacteroidota bacterium]MDP4244161.1 D-alanine--D-alanine ligase [Bacteroidota bacterium]MDP4289323.1 D-alanine--D-alanine ligase [Bacteroidota bacterium]
MKIAVIYNEPRNTAAEDHWLRRSDPDYRPPSADFVDASEHGVVQQMHSIAAALSGRGHEVSIFSADDDPGRLCEFLRSERPDAIFNCCESIMGQSRLEMNVAALYELFGTEYTGSPALALGIALDKALAKSIFESREIPTPKHQLFSEGDQFAGGLAFPVIVKPAQEDASIGIDSNAIVENETALMARVRFILNEFEQPALAEEFIDGRELNVAVIGGPDGMLETLPISEITFDKMPPGMPHIVSYEAKWVEESPVYHTTVPECPARLPASVEAAARRIALAAAAAVGLRDYGRVDMRLDASDRIFVLEANPNPDISEDAGFMRAARASGRTYDGTINEILDLAIARKTDDSRTFKK